jgi:hypothetical protein
VKRNYWIFGFGGFCFLLVSGLVAFTILFLVHDRTVGCHERVRKTDACWKDLNEQVRDLQARVRVLEQR